MQNTLRSCNLEISSIIVSPLMDANFCMDWVRTLHQKRWCLLEGPSGVALAPISYKNPFRARKNKMWGNAAIFIVHVMLRIFFVHVRGVSKKSVDKSNNFNRIYRKVKLFCRRWYQNVRDTYEKYQTCIFNESKKALVLDMQGCSMRRSHHNVMTSTWREWYIRSLIKY